jgi:hypothetical protein
VEAPQERKAREEAEALERRAKEEGEARLRQAEREIEAKRRDAVVEAEARRRIARDRAGEVRQNIRTELERIRKAHETLIRKVLKTEQSDGSSLSEARTVAETVATSLEALNPPLPKGVWQGGIKVFGRGLPEGRHEFYDFDHLVEKFRDYRMLDQSELQQTGCRVIVNSLLNCGYSIIQQKKRGHIVVFSRRLPIRLSPAIAEETSRQYCAHQHPVITHRNCLGGKGKPARWKMVFVAD